ncbi:hypothetical protein [Polynucleobacter sp. AP-Sving-400A-A2]|uniref:hypothetical protein n=1 Tax=Polynucleobacter sp. AP-Sving-400A-A2 TaxID=2081049 RepID=UPI001BFEBFE8|nr:hypothetical protein [Polynucleobacter sp. AP-Sving-400A-A2]QWE15358.1 hypothetical protein C2758_04325 [Polynucleobacter sp. AP-Sving-400A-A2]
MVNNLYNKKGIFIALAISICFLIIVILYGKKSIDNEEILGLKIGMSASEALKKYPDFVCNKKSGYICSTTISGQLLEININAKEDIYRIQSAVTLNNMELAEVMSAASKEYSSANSIDGGYFYWYFDKEGDGQKLISITKNNSYHWFCKPFGFVEMKVPNCESQSVMIYKRLYDGKKYSVWFDKNSPELNKLKQ